MLTQLFHILCLKTFALSKGTSYNHFKVLKEVSPSAMSKIKYCNINETLYVHKPVKESHQNSCKVIKKEEYKI